MVRTTFQQRFDSCIKFYDYAYHLHKSTYKGLSSFYKQYAELQRSYADSLLSLAKQIPSQVPQLSKQSPPIAASIKEIIGCMQATSQLHYNYGEKLVEIGSYYNSEYYIAKRKKDALMKMLKDRNEEEYNSMRERNRSALVDKEREICLGLYQNLGKLAEEDNERVHKVKQQTIIYFSIYKKVCEKELELTAEYKNKQARQEIQVRNTKIAQIAEQLRLHINEYGGEQVQRRSYDNSKVLPVMKQSLRSSMAAKQRIIKSAQTENKLMKLIEQYEVSQDNLIVMTINETCYGLLDPSLFAQQQRRKYARQINSQTVRHIAYDMLEGYCKSKGVGSDEMMLLQLIKSYLRVKPSTAVITNFNCSTMDHYWQQVKSQIIDTEYIFNAKMIQQISACTGSEFQRIDAVVVSKLNNKLGVGDLSSECRLPFHLRHCIVDILLEPVFITKPDEPVLTQGFVDFLHLLAQFGEGFLGLSRRVCVLLFMRKLVRLLQGKNTNQELQLLINDEYFRQGDPPQLSLSEQQQSTLSAWSSTIHNTTTNKLCKFYTLSESFLNYFKLLMVMEKTRLTPISSFNARDHFYASIRCAGFNYMKSGDSTGRLLGTGRLGQDRVRGLVEVLEELDYEGVCATYFEPCSKQIASLLGVGDQKVSAKLFEEFTQPISQIINANLGLLANQQGMDPQGYILRLGIILSKFDIRNPQPISEYDTFFTVLQTYLQTTENNYDNLLEHSRKTQLWIMEQNSMATANCIDFCSLLYKPFEFLLTSLKQMETSKQTDYTKKYSEFIKLRLNTVLKTQIIKYINFLYQSLLSFRSSAPELTLKPRRLEKPHALSKQQMDKQKMGFKQLTRRLFNLLFLKDQLEEMVCDFIDPKIYKELGNSIFNVDKLNKVAAYPEYRDIMTNIKQIVESVLANEQRIVQRVASIAVNHFMSKIFDNLYFQADKNAVEQFFSSSADKLSEHTFLRYQEPLEDWFVLIYKNIPQQLLDYFSTEFTKYFYTATQFQILNSTKFKLPLKPEKVVPYLDSDVAFVITTMKQKFFDEAVIIAHLKAPFKQLLADLQAQTSKLTGVFEAATLKNDKEKCKYVLVLLNLRVKDDKAMQFVKKYKSIIQV